MIKPTMHGGAYVYIYKVYQKFDLAYRLYHKRIMPSQKTLACGPRGHKPLGWLVVTLCVDTCRSRDRPTRDRQLTVVRVCWFNPFPDKQPNVVGVVPEQICHFSSLDIFCLGCKTISRRSARELIVLHPKQNISSERK
jgi:hypothetical protein